jgi:hypothetical protein
MIVRLVEEKRQLNAELIVKFVNGVVHNTVVFPELTV